MAQRATATCYCGAVQLEVVSIVFYLGTDISNLLNACTDTRQPVEGEDLVNTHVCHCKDCRKVTATMFASNVRPPSNPHNLAHTYPLTPSTALRQRLSLSPHPRRRQVNLLLHQRNHRHRQHDDQLFLLGLWHAHVPPQQWVSWVEFLSHRDCG